MGTIAHRGSDALTPVIWGIEADVVALAEAFDGADADD